ncbi:unnamed protein product, partial [Didymodactylos carnosus]
CKEVTFDLAGTLTVLVGPNNAGKTGLLQSIRVFCNAVKGGSQGYSFETAKNLSLTHPGIDIEMCGTFVVEYAAGDLKKLEL